MKGSRRRSPCRPWLLPLLILVAPGLQGVAAGEEWRFDDVSRVVAVSDVHGDFDALSTTLERAGIIDAERRWTGGDTHFVVTGDILDRGADSRAVMDLLMSLETAAAEAGGAVHLLLGNHEVMNLIGDLRYVSTEEFAAFAGDEPAELREDWFAHYRSVQQDEADEALARRDFDARYPPGFFAHRRAFRADGQYGSWLLDKPILIVVNDSAFVHGGLSPLAGELGLPGINGDLKGELRRYVESLAVLVDARVLDPAENFYRHAEVLEDLPEDAIADPEVAAAAETVASLNGSRLSEPDSPLWYRGNVGCGELIETDRLGPVLEAIGARRVVIGHTPTPNREVLERLGGRVVEIDTGMLSKYYDGSGHALLIDADGMTVVAEADDRGPVTPHPRRVGVRPGEFGREELERLLADGDIVSRAEAADDRIEVTLEHDGREVAAVFVPNPRGNDLMPDLAAYQLDLFLGLDMVPVTVSREIDGVAGVLQFRPANTMTELERRDSGRGGSAWCPLPEQWGAMYVFDSLIHNPGRAQDRMLYSEDNWQLMLTGHDVSFTGSRSRPGYLRDVVLPLGSAWRERLQALDERTVERLFRDTLDKRRRRALSARRDQLLEDAAADE